MLEGVRENEEGCCFESIVCTLRVDFFVLFSGNTIRLPCTFLHLQTIRAGYSVSSMCTLVAKLIELRLVFTYMVPTRLYKGRAEECTIFYFLLALLLWIGIREHSWSWYYGTICSHKYREGDNCSANLIETKHLQKHIRWIVIITVALLFLVLNAFQNNIKVLYW